MQSVKSYFNFSLFRKNLARFWPIWSSYLVIWVLLMPLNFLTQDYYGYEPLSMVEVGLFLAVPFGVLCAMAVFSYLYNSKSVQLMHSLPIRREGLFLTNYLSGLSFLLLPNILVFFLTLLAGGFRSSYTVILWLVAQCLMCIFFYSFAVFCAMFTGNLLALPVFYGILNFLTVGLFTIITSLLREFLFGFAGTTGLDELILWLTPAVRLAEKIGYDTIQSGSYYLTGLPSILLYGFVGILLAVAALFIYRRRKLESAGDLVSIRWVRPVFKYGVAFCTAVALGTWFYNVFRQLLPPADWAILLPLLLCGLIGYFAADMLLKKSFKVFGRAWKGAACFCLIMVATFFATNLDLFGYNNTPARSGVVSVQLRGVNTRPGDSASYTDLTLTESADIDAVLKLHGLIADNKNTIRAQLAADDGNYNTRWHTETLTDGTRLEVQKLDTTYLYLNYTLTDGRVIRRQYDLPLSADALNDPDSIESTLSELINRPSIVERLYWESANISPDAKLVDVTLDSHIGPNQGYETVSIEEDADRDRLLAAVKADMAAGRIGVRYLMDTAERYENCYYNDLTFSFYRPAASNKADNGGKPAAMVESRDWAISVTLQATATETLKVLEELGYTTGEELVTWVEQMRYNGAETKAQEVEYADSTLRAVG